MNLIGSVSHLVSRFFGVLFAKPLLPSERAAISEWLNDDEAALFFDQPYFDQRHAYHTGLKVVALGVHETRVIKAALLHDVGKRHCGLGAFGRSAATLWNVTRLPGPERFAQYRDHGPIGARELEEIGCEPVVVDFARHHPGQRPPTISPATWNVLRRADQTSKPEALAGT